MLETIAGGCRAVASDPRLIMLCRLVESPELAASELARRAGVGTVAGGAASATDGGSTLRTFEGP